MFSFYSDLCMALMVVVVGAILFVFLSIMGGDRSNYLATLKLLLFAMLLLMVSHMAATIYHTRDQVNQMAVQISKQLGTRKAAGL